MDKYFNEEEISKILCVNKVNNYDLNTLGTKSDDIFNYFRSKKISVGNIRYMILDFPRLLTYSVDLIKNRYDHIEKIFKKYTNKFVISNSRIFSHDNKYFDDRIEYFIRLGIEDDELIKVLLNCPTLTTIGEINLDISINNLSSKIEDKEMLINLIKSNSKVLSYSTKTINDKFDWFYNKGYSKKDAAKIICKADKILTLNYYQDDNLDSNMDNKYKFLVDNLKYTKEEIIDITLSFPEYYTLSLNTIRNRLYNMTKLGFNLNQVKKIFYDFPEIISFKEETLNDKYDYFLKLDMLDIFFKDPKYLMQSLKLTKARYNFMIDRGLRVNKNNYGKLFVGNKKFKKTYGIDNDTLLEKYGENNEVLHKKHNRVL